MAQADASPFAQLDDAPYQLSDELIAALQTPALVVYMDRVRENVQRERMCCLQDAAAVRGSAYNAAARLGVPRVHRIVVVRALDNRAPHVPPARPPRLYSRKQLISWVRRR